MNATLTPPRNTISRGTDLRPETVAPLTQLLRQLADVVERLDDVRYTQKPVGVIESSVGGHVRHCLDHVRSLLSAVETGHLDYDRRERDTPVETAPGCALAAIADMTSGLDALPAGAIARRLTVSVSMSAGAPPVAVASSVGRELAYVLSHTIHHNAIVNAMVRTLGGWVPERFGYAPATIASMEGRTCVR
jgi:uncharacterized damage-inducible protein DinB